MSARDSKSEPATHWLSVGAGEAVMVWEFGAGNPICSFLAGVHGDEREGAVALQRLASVLGQSDLAGTIRMVPVANPPAYHTNARLSPRDGQNLARAFPGNDRGSITERIAAALTSRVIAGSDVLVDLHSAGTQWSMPFYVGYVHSDTLGVASMSAARAFGAELIWRHDVGGPGRSLSAARNLGVPSIYVETGGGGRLVEADVAAYVDGCTGVLAELGVIATAVPSSRRPMRVVSGGHGDLDRGLEAPIGGHLISAVDAGQIIDVGEAMFTIEPENGASGMDVTAPGRGIIMALRRATAVVAGDPLALIAPCPVDWPGDSS